MELRFSFDGAAMELITAAVSASASAPVAAASGSITPAAGAKLSEVETEAPPPPRLQPLKPLSTSNGVLKRHPPFSPPPAVTYRDCLKNHAASLGRYAVDGCGEFMPSPSSTPADPTSLKCAACGCHRNFHRREPEDPSPTSLPVLEYQPHHRHLPPPPLAASPDSQSPPPISSSYYPPAPHMLLALSTGLAGHPDISSPAINATPTAAAHPSLSHSPNGRKRFRTKFSPGQKEKMHHFAERIGWKMQKKDDELVAQFCCEAGVERGVFKVWMHNNKNTLGRRDCHHNDGGGDGAAALENAGLDIHVAAAVHDDDDDDDERHENQISNPIFYTHHHLHQHPLDAAPFGANGSSPS